ncbi:F-box protein At1g67340-like [Impatiens glandulifera]|uniref:F-box protein At1g67340-like n=1 Tax=Impatiens glandulifera TaxID=253017 RepID=UPI001FB09141|nr:F-box protein At1g67340-like [Impatiens glandulifera]
MEMMMMMKNTCYYKEPSPPNKSRRRNHHHPATASRRRDFFQDLPDDLLLVILSKLSISATSPSHFINLSITCKRFHALSLQPMVLSKASTNILAVKPNNWSDSAHRFLKLCADSGNIEASYILGMIRFYCLQNRVSGASLMAKAAIHSHPSALYSLAIIHFNGSGGTKNNKDLRAGFSLCARAAFLGHVDALREIGHSLQDGYGVRQNISYARRFLLQANARDLNREEPPHPANRFLTEWFCSRGFQLCSQATCGRPETRRHEFRRCSVCEKVNYCSRACQALDWKIRHKKDCAPPMDQNGR